ncbi:hypothetical protein V8E53_002250 [Lactarius tabidus]
MNETGARPRMMVVTTQITIHPICYSNITSGNSHSEPLNALKMEDVMQEIWDLCTDLANAQEVGISFGFGVIQVANSDSSRIEGECDDLLRAILGHNKLLTVIIMHTKSRNGTIQTKEKVDQFLDEQEYNVPGDATEQYHPQTPMGQWIHHENGFLTILLDTESRPASDKCSICHTYKALSKHFKDNIKKWLKEDKDAQDLGNTTGWQLDIRFGVKGLS